MSLATRQDSLGSKGGSSSWIRRIWLVLCGFLSGRPPPAGAGSTHALAGGSEPSGAAWQAERIAELQNALDQEHEKSRRLQQQVKQLHQSLHQALRVTVDKLKDDCQQGQSAVVGRVDEASQASEKGVLQTGHCVSSIVDMAREQITDFERIQHEVGQGSEIGTAIAEQRAAIETFVERLRNDLENQNETASRAVEQSNQVVVAGKTIRDIARASKILNLNAQIEAARLGTEGEPFAIIARNMVDLSRRVEQANQIIGEVAVSMRNSLPQLGQMASSMLQMAIDFGDDLHTTLERVHDAEGNLRVLVRGSVSESKNRVDEILQTSHEAISALQFQDPMQQCLRQIPYTTQTLLNRVPAMLSKVAPELELDSRMVDEEVEEHWAAPLSTADPLGREEDRPEAGEVMLF